MENKKKTLAEAIELLESEGYLSKPVDIGFEDPVWLFRVPVDTPPGHGQCLHHFLRRLPWNRIQCKICGLTWNQINDSEWIPVIDGETPPEPKKEEWHEEYCPYDGDVTCEECDGLAKCFEHLKQELHKANIESMKPIDVESHCKRCILTSVSDGKITEDFGEFLLKQSPDICLWTNEEDTDNWGTACGHRWTMLAESPSQNKMVFCPYCGKRLEEKPPEPEHMESPYPSDICPECYMPMEEIGCDSCKGNGGTYDCCDNPNEPDAFLVCGRCSGKGFYWICRNAERPSKERQEVEFPLSRTLIMYCKAKKCPYNFKVMDGTCVNCPSYSQKYKSEIKNDYKFWSVSKDEPKTDIDKINKWAEDLGCQIFVDPSVPVGTVYVRKVKPLSLTGEQ